MRHNDGVFVEQFHEHVTHRALRSVEWVLRVLLPFWFGLRDTNCQPSVIAACDLLNADSHHFFAIVADNQSSRVDLPLHQRAFRVFIRVLDLCP
jgi:hypothetical protein